MTGLIVLAALAGFAWLYYELGQHEKRRRAAIDLHLEHILSTKEN